MHIRGERIIIFGDSLTHHGADNGPEIWDVNAGSARPSSAPGDLLASLLAEDGASAVRTNARVGRSAANFYERENATALLASDRAFRPTKVVVMLGTNDIGRDPAKTANAMAGIRSAYEGMGAEVWAIGPLTYNNAALNAQSASVAQIMGNVFGGRFIDGRPLSVQTARAGDGVHFRPDSARQTALNLQRALLGASGHGNLIPSLMLGAGLAVGAIMLFRAFADPTPRTRRGVLGDLTQHLLGAPEDPPKPSIDELARRARKAREARERMVRDAFGKSPAVIISTSHGGEKLAIMSGEMQNTEHGKLRVTYFDEDGPIGHATRPSLKAIIEDVIDYYPTAVRPATDEEVIRWTSTERYQKGAEHVAEMQRRNSGLKGSKARKRTSRRQRPG